MRWGARVAIGVGVVLAAIQLIRPERTSPPSRPEEALRPPPDVAAIFARSCDDCHSNQTRWPWYSNVAPISWLVVHDVNEGRAAVNYSEWARYAPDQQAELLAETCVEMEEGEMPPSYYLPLHPDARLSPADVQGVCAWARGVGQGAP